MVMSGWGTPLLPPPPPGGDRAYYEKTESRT
jgi:hypothetical protein